MPALLPNPTGTAGAHLPVAIPAPRTPSDDARPAPVHPARRPTAELPARLGRAGTLAARAGSLVVLAATLVIGVAIVGLVDGAPADPGTLPSLSATR